MASRIDDTLFVVPANRRSGIPSPCTATPSATGDSNTSWADTGDSKTASTDTCDSTAAGNATAVRSENWPHP
ncbi:MAG: hypothetical protein KKD63_14450 [Proteobacteria bacterium]|nr:hypothetical protein [Desulfobulbaceae bacterium]MBU4154069.1 hypothetical protein [Pseudomonadota bacterium]MDP2106522.1 hypothetical protein [Desulfobulbaceae bacterium]